MGNQNDILGPSGGVPAMRDGASFANLTAAGNYQVKTSSGIFQRLGVNTGVSSGAAALYDGLSATVTVTIASPGVFTWANHGLAAGTAVEFTTTGALPTGLTAGTKYYVANDANLTANTFAVSDTQAHALAGTNQVNTSGTQSGVHTGWNVGTPIGNYAALTTSPAMYDVGAYFRQGLIAIVAQSPDLTVLYN